MKKKTNSILSTMLLLMTLSLASCNGSTPNSNSSGSDGTSSPKISSSVHTHQWDEGTTTKEPTCEDKGIKEYRCKECGEKKEEELPALGHNYGAASYEWAEDFTSCTATKKCSRCNKEITETVNNIEPVEVPATCTEDGSKTYTANFTNKELGSDQKVVTITKLNHDYDYENAVYEWNGYESCIATISCKNDSSHKITREATITSSIKEEATCTKEGTKVYTASFSDASLLTQTKEEVIPMIAHVYDEGTITKNPTCTEKGEKTYSCTVCGNKKVESVDELGHSYDYSNVTYNWEDDGSACIATVICTRCQDEKKIPASNITKERITEPTCTDNGLDRFTATFDELNIEPSTKDLEVAETGHNYGEIQRRFIESSNSIQEYKICANDSTHEEIVSTNALQKIQTFSPTKDGLTGYDAYIYRGEQHITLSFVAQTAWKENEQIKVYYDFGDNISVSHKRALDKTMGYFFLTPSSNTLAAYEFYGDNENINIGKGVVTTVNEEMTIASIDIPLSVFSVSVPEEIGLDFGSLLNDGTTTTEEYFVNVQKGWLFTKVDSSNQIVEEGVKLNDVEAGETAPALSLYVRRKENYAIFTVKNTSAANWNKTERFYVLLDGSDGKPTTQGSFNTDGSNTYLLFNFTSATAVNRYYRTSNNDQRFNAADNSEYIDANKTTYFADYNISGNIAKFVLDLSVMDEKLGTSYATKNLGVAYVTGTSATGKQYQKNSLGTTGKPTDITKYQKIDVNGNLVE